MMGSDSVEYLKAKVKDQLEVPPNQQDLTFSGQKLRDERALASYEVNDGCTIILRVVTGVEIFIRTQTRKTLTIDDVKASASR